MSNEIEDLENKRRLLTCLNKIEGQIKGIQRMIEAERSCGDVLTQISATQSAISKVGDLLLERYTKTCLLNSINSEESFNENILDNFLNNIEKFLKYNN